MTHGPHLTLAPASPRGWFGGRSLEAAEPCEVRSGVSLAEAAATLEAEFTGSGAGLTAVLATYEGVCTVVRFARVTEGFTAAGPVAAAADGPLLTDAGWDLDASAFRAGVEATRERIACGGVYVLNLTARLAGRLAVASPAEAFAALSQRAQADMAALLGGLPGETPWIASVSPERFVRVARAGRGEDSARVVEVHPIKGTRPRGATPEGDALLASELALSEKERAEHIMIVDLERNDLGLSCVPGSVHVDPLASVVETRYCHQMVSVVRGTLRPDATFAELLAGVFPCGSVTGAPKRAAMRIIDELEASDRGAYCGALLVAVPGELDSSVLIRTLSGDATEPHRARWGAGAGITFDSDPAAEYLEMLLKTSPVLGDGIPPVALRETMRVIGGRVPLLDRHLARLASGGAGPSLLAIVRDKVAEQLLAVDPALEYTRLGVTVTPDGEVSAGVTMAASSLAVPGGPRIAPVEVEVAPTLPSGAAKPASRRFWDRAHGLAHGAGADQAVLHTPDGTLVDGSTANVWLVREGALATPPAPPAVAGVMRSVVADAAARLDIACSESALTLDDLAAADEVWLSNAVGGFVPARGRSGPVGERIAQAVAQVFSAGG